MMTEIDRRAVKVILALCDMETPLGRLDLSFLRRLLSQPQAALPSRSRSFSFRSLQPRSERSSGASA